jgi:hypothetical protein
MAAKLIQVSGDRSFLLELLHFAGWRLQVREGSTTTIRAARSGVLLEASGSTLPEAVGRLFARAMRSSPTRR